MAQYIEESSFGGNLGKALGGGLLAGVDAYGRAREAKMKQQSSAEFAKLLQGLGGGGGMPEGMDFSQLTPEQLKFATDLRFKQIEGDKKREQIERHHEEKMTSQAWKDVEKDITSARSASEEGRDVTDRVYKMKALEKTKKLDSPAKTAILQKLGLDWMLSPESQSFIKENAGFMSGAKKSVGADVSNYQLQAHMKRYPSLLMTPKGRELVYDDLIRTESLKEKYYDTMKQVIKDNGGKPPRDLAFQTEERMKPTYDKYRQKYIDSISKAAEMAPLAEDKAQNEGNYEGAQFDASFPPAKFKGETLEDNGQYYQSDGTGWKLVGKGQGSPQQQQAPQAPLAPVSTSPNLPPIDFDTFLTDSHGFNYNEI